MTPCIITFLTFISILQLGLASVYQPVLSDPARTYLWDMYLSDTPGLEVLAQNWHINNEIGASRLWTTCDDGYLPFLGGIDLTTPISSWERTYAGISSHNIVYYNILLYILGSWKPHNYLSIQFGDSPAKIWNFASLISNYGGTDYCYEGRVDFYGRIYGKALHTGDVLTIKMSYDLSSTTGPNVGFGFRDLTLIFRDNTGSEINEDFIELVDDTTSIPEASHCYIWEYWSVGDNGCEWCADGCMNCFSGSSSDCDKCHWGYAPINGVCTACHSTCGFCTGPNANECVACYDSSLVLDYDNTCKATCTPPYILRGSGEAQKCITPCNPGQFMVWDGSCVNSCPSPLVQSTADGINFCDSPCNQAAYEYYNWDGTCVTTCDADKTRTTPYGYLFCDPCPIGQMMIWDQSCVSTCPSPLIESTVDNVKYCNSPCDQAASEYYNWDETCVPTCDTPNIRTVPYGYLFCDACPPGQFQIWDESCVATCPSPLIENTNTNGVLTCNSPCDQAANEYYNWDGTCVTTCDIDKTRTTPYGYLFCDPCPIGEMMIWDESCVSTCPLPLIESTVDNVKYCNSPCDQAASEYYNWDGNCVTTCEVDKIRTVPYGYLFCDACPPGQLQIWDETCVETCPSPLIENTKTNGIKSCDSPCDQAANEYYNWDGTCVISCETSTIRTVPPGYLFCDICPQDQVKSGNIDGPCILTSQCNYPNSLIDDENFSSIKICTANLTPEQTQQMDKINQFLQASGFFAIFICILKSILNLNGAQLILIIYVSKMLRYSRYLFINYPLKVKYMLELNDSAFGIFNSPSFASDGLQSQFPDYPLPLASNDPHLHSSFFINYLDKIIVFLFIICATGVVYLGKLHATKYPKIQKFCEKSFVLFKWNYFFLVIIAEYGDMVFFTCLQMVTMHFDSVPTIISFVICILVNMLGVYILFKVFTINLSQREILKKFRKEGQFDAEEEELSKKWENYKICFVEYKNHTFAQQTFLLVSVIRMVIFNLAIGLLYNHPLTQVIILLALSIAMCTYLMTQRPMRERLTFIENLISEAFLLAYNICLIYLAVLDNKNQEQAANRDKIGEFMIAINIALKFVFTVFGVIVIYLWLKGVYIHFMKTRIAQNRKKVIPIRIPEGLISPKQALTQKAPFSAKGTLTDIDLGSSLEEGNSSKTRLFFNSNNKSRVVSFSQEFPIKDSSKILGSGSSIETGEFLSSNFIRSSRTRHLSRRTHSQFKEDHEMKSTMREITIGSKRDLIEDHTRSDSSSQKNIRKYFF